jgi:hypothetical protein
LSRFVNPNNKTINWNDFVADPKAKNPKCKLCEKECLSGRSFKLHLQRAHFREKFACDACFKTHATKASLNRQFKVQQSEPSYASYAANYLKTNLVFNTMQKSTPPTKCRIKIGIRQPYTTI